MQGETEASGQHLAEAVTWATDNGQELDLIAALMSKAELLSLDYHDDKALDVFRDEIDPRLGHLPAEVGLVVSDNRNVVSTALFTNDSMYEFHRGFDERRIAGLDIWRAQDIVFSEESAAAGRHPEALPGLWQHLLKAHRVGSWRSLRLAAKRGFWDDAGLFPRRGSLNPP